MTGPSKNYSTIIISTLSVLSLCVDYQVLREEFALYKAEFVQNTCGFVNLGCIHSIASQL